MQIIEAPSPNFEQRKDKIRFIIFHATALPTSEDSLKILRESRAPNRVSAHYLIDRDGVVYRLVQDEKKAFHAGISDWSGLEHGKTIKSLNDASIGIEFQCPHENDKFSLFTKKQVSSGIELCHMLMKRHGLKPGDIWGHSDIAPHRKQDPGATFPWRTFGKAKIGLWTDKKEPQNKRLLKRPIAELLALIGYPVFYGIDKNVIAFKRHFMPHAHLTAAVSNLTLKRAAVIAELVLKNHQSTIG